MENQAIPNKIKSKKSLSDEVRTLLHEAGGLPSKHSIQIKDEETTTKIPYLDFLKDGLTTNFLVVKKKKKCTSAMPCKNNFQSRFISTAVLRLKIG